MVAMLFRDKSNAEVRAALLRAKRDGRAAFEIDCRRALEYLAGDMINDVRRELATTYRENNIGATAGQEMRPVAIPLTERFIAEQATAYNRHVERKLVEPDGEESDFAREMTDVLNRHLDKSSYDETMHEHSRRICLLKSNGLWQEAKHGTLRPTLYAPCDIYPMAKASPVGASRADQRDYEGFVVETTWSAEDVSAAERRTFILITADEAVYYRGTEPHQHGETISSFENTYEFNQYDDELGRVVKKPGQMFTVWHKSIPVEALIPDAPSPIADMNREVNLALSALLDVVRFQGFSAIAITSGNKQRFTGRRAWGPRHPLLLNLEERIEMLSSATNYTQQVEILKFMVSAMAVAERLSPNDVSLDGSGAAASSGFAKLVDSLPKLDARHELLTRLTAMEENFAGPRNIAILVQLGEMPEAALNLKTQVRFEGVRFPEAQDERAKRYETDLKHNLTTRAAILAEQKNISIEDAREEIEENRAENGTSGAGEQPQGQQRGPMPTGILGGIIGQRRLQQPQQQQRNEEQDDDAESR
jgi:hypothetical protein